MTHSPAPSPENGFLAEHVQLLLRSFAELTGGRLLPEASDGAETARMLYEAPFVVLSHGAQPDPIFNYGNLAAQKLFELDWHELTRLPSRFSAEQPNRDERERLLRRVSEHGFIDDYRGIRISKSGRRFEIRQAVVWNLIDARGRKLGQAATFAEWTFLDAKKNGATHTQA